MFCENIFSERLKQLRKEHALTMQQLAKKIGCTQTTIGNLENAKKKPSLDMIYLIADYFKVSIDYLAGRIDSAEIFEKIVPMPSYSRLTFVQAYRIALKENKLIHLVSDVYIVPDKNVKDECCTSYHGEFKLLSLKKGKDQKLLSWNPTFKELERNNYEVVDWPDIELKKYFSTN